MNWCLIAFCIIYGWLIISSILWVFERDEPEEDGYIAAIEGKSRNSNRYVYQIWWSLWDSGWERGWIELQQRKLAEHNGMDENRIASIPKPLEKPYVFPKWVLIFPVIMIILIILQFLEII